jgi:hypothetical protein
MATLAGLEFLSSSATLQAAPQGGWVRAYALSGRSYGVCFRANFDASEDTHEILHLALAVAPEARSELAAFIATCVRVPGTLRGKSTAHTHRRPWAIGHRSERERALLVFFKGLVRYARLRAHRLRLFARLQEQFPSLVSFPHAPAFSTSAVFMRPT